LPAKSSLATTKKTATTTTKSATTAKKAITTPTKKVVRRIYRRRNVKPLPSPSPKWPPTNFVSGGSVYGKVPSAKELQGVLAGAGNKSQLYKDSQSCVSKVCGVLQVASDTACTYWEVDSVLYSDPVAKDLIGTLHTYAPGTRAKKISTIYLITPVALQDGYFVGSIKANCWTQAPTATIPSNDYVAK
jgi:hypothetical protein